MKDSGNRGEWVPKGWPFFQGIGKKENQSLYKSAQDKIVYGLSYRVESEPVWYRGRNLDLHILRIDSWEYTIQQDSNERPVLTISFLDRYDARIPLEHLVLSIKVMGCPVAVTRHSARRVMLTAQLFLKQISAGQIPDVDNVLRIYRVNPLQAGQIPAAGEENKNTNQDTMRK